MQVEDVASGRLAQAAFVVIGMVGAWSFHCFLSDPNMMQHFYQLTSGDEKAVPRHPSLWHNILNLITIVRLTSNFCTQALNVSFLCRDRSLFGRIYAGLAAIVVVLLVPIMLIVSHASEVVTFALILSAVGLSGIATGFQQSTLFSLGALFEESAFAQSALVGMAVSAAVASYVKVIAKLSFGSTFDDKRTQTLMYYGLGIALVFAAALCLKWFRATAMAAKVVPELTSPPEEDRADAVDDSDEHPLNTHADADASTAGGILRLMWALRWLAAANSLVFVASFLVFPGVLAKIEPHDTWFKILVVLTFQTALTVGRLSSRWFAPLLGGRLLDGKVLTVAAVARFVVFPPIFIFAFAKGGHAQAIVYVVTALCQVIAGVLSGLISIAVPRAAGVDSARDKVIAGNLLSLGILIASTVGTLGNLAVCHWYLN